MSQLPEFTQEQADWICYQIGEWYIEWKHKIGGQHQHRLGYAKEILKQMVCPIKCSICNESLALLTWENCFDCEMKKRADESEDNESNLTNKE